MACQDNSQLLFTLNGPPRSVQGVVMVKNCVYVVYDYHNKVEVFDCENCCKKIKEIEVEGLKKPRDMVGSSVTSQLFIRDSRYVIKVDLKTGVSDVFTTCDDVGYSLSLVENRLLVTSRDSLLMYDIHSGEKLKDIPLTGKGVKVYADGEIQLIEYAIESNRDSFFVINAMPYHTTFKDIVSELDSEGRVIARYTNEQSFCCNYLALDSVGGLLVANGNKQYVHEIRIVSIDEHLNVERTLIDDTRLGNSPPLRLNYNKNNNRLAVGFGNGLVKIFEC